MPSLLLHADIAQIRIGRKGNTHPADQRIVLGATGWLLARALVGRQVPDGNRRRPNVPRTQARHDLPQFTDIAYGSSRFGVRSIREIRQVMLHHAGDTTNAERLLNGWRYFEELGKQIEDRVAEVNTAGLGIELTRLRSDRDQIAVEASGRQIGRLVATLHLPARTIEVARAPRSISEGETLFELHATDDRDAVVAVESDARTREARSRTPGELTDDLLEAWCRDMLGLPRDRMRDLVADDALPPASPHTPPPHKPPPQKPPPRAPVSSRGPRSRRRR